MPLYNKHESVIIDLVTPIALKMNESVDWLLSQIQTDLYCLETDTDFWKYVNNVIKKEMLGFNHVSFLPYRKKEIEHDKYVECPFQAEEGVVQCVKCKSMRVYSVSVQTRAADEPMTTSSVCTQCHHKWSQNG